MVNKKRAKRVGAEKIVKRARRKRAKRTVINPDFIEVSIPAPKSDEELPAVDMAEIYRQQVQALKTMLYDSVKGNIETMRDLIAAQETLTQYRRTVLENMELAVPESESNDWPKYEHCEWDDEYGWKWREGYRPYHLNQLELIEADRIIKKYVKEKGREKSQVEHVPTVKPRRRRRTRAEMEAAGERTRSRSGSSKPAVAVAEPEPVESTNEQEVQTISYDG